MKKLVLFFCVGTAVLGRPAAGESPAATRSARLTAAAEQLLEYEKKMVASSPDSIGDDLFGDVLALLDSAVAANPTNVHARALRSELLLHESYAGEGEYDVCYLIDAKTDAEYVVSHASTAAATDVTMARNVLRGIEKIPPEAIPDPPSVCDAEDDRHSGTRTSAPHPRFADPLPAVAGRGVTQPSPRLRCEGDRRPGEGTRR